MKVLFKKIQKLSACGMLSVGLALSAQPAMAFTYNGSIFDAISDIAEYEMDELQTIMDGSERSYDEYNTIDDYSPSDAYYDPPTPKRNKRIQRVENRSRQPHSGETGFNARVGYTGEPGIVLKLMNEERMANGLDALVPDATLTNAAKERAAEIRSRFDHVRPDGSDALTVLEDYDIRYSHAGENIAYGDGMSGKKAYNCWHNSDGHYRNMMSKDFTHVGIGYYRDGNGRAYWVQLFAAPQ